MRRTRQAILQADLVLLMLDATECDSPINSETFINELRINIPPTIPLLLIRNKIDLLQQLPQHTQWLLNNDIKYDVIDLSAREQQALNC